MGEQRSDADQDVTDRLIQAEAKTWGSYLFAQRTFRLPPGRKIDAGKAALAQKRERALGPAGE